MTITTRYDINQEVFIIKNGKILEGKVNKITPDFKGSGDRIVVYYDIDYYGEYCKGINEICVYKTKKEAVCEMVKRSGYKVSEDSLIEIR